MSEEKSITIAHQQDSDGGTKISINTEMGPAESIEVMLLTTLVVLRELKEMANAPRH